MVRAISANFPWISARDIRAVAKALRELGFDPILMPQEERHMSFQRRYGSKYQGLVYVPRGFEGFESRLIKVPTYDELRLRAVDDLTQTRKALQGGREALLEAIAHHKATPTKGEAPRGSQRPCEASGSF